MNKPKHIAMMIAGAVLTRAFLPWAPTSWWMPRGRGWMRWTLPIMGYYGWHPAELKWWEPMTDEWEG